MAPIVLFMLFGLSFARPEMGQEPLSPSAPTDVCMSCREVTGFTRRLFDTNDLTIVKTNLTKWCMAEGTPAPKDVCTQYVEDGIAVLQRVGSDSFCERLDACPLDSNILSAIDTHDNTSCDFCINVVTHIKGIVASPQTESEFKKSLQNACNHCPVKDECIAMLDKNIDSLFTFLRDKLNPSRVCKSIGYCSLKSDNSMNQRVKPSLDQVVGVFPAGSLQEIPFTKIEAAEAVESNGNPMNCLICKQVASWAIRKLKDNRTEEAIVEALDQVCDRIFSKGKQTECEAFVKTYTDELISIFKETDDPKLICVLLGVCDKAVFENEQPNAGPTIAHCRMCLDSSRWLLDHVGPDRTDSSLSAAIEDVCNSGSYEESDRKMCSDYVTHNDAMIRDAVRSNGEPKAICGRLELCRREWIDATEREEVQSLPSCYVCREIAKWVNRQVKQNRTEESIEAALASVCKVLKRVDNCDAKVADWSARLIMVLKTASDPQVACELLQVCGFPKNQVENEEESDADEESSPGVCFECRTITHFIQEELYSYDKEKRVEDFVIKNVCDKIPSGIEKETCESFVNQYGPSLMQLIAQKAFNSKLVCEDELHLCPKTPPTSPQTDIEVSSQHTCNLCTASVRELDSLLSVGEIDREISQLALKTCQRLPQKDEKQCITLIEAFGPYFLQMVGRMSNAREVCKELDLCSNPGEVQLLGGHKCSFGPSYWCHTIAHASACKAEGYCRRIWEPIEQRG